MGRGRGTTNIVNLSKEAGNPEPKFIATDIDFTVCLSLKEPIGHEKTNANKPKPTKIVELNARHKEILEIIKQSGSVTLKQIMLALNNAYSERTIQRGLSYLKKHGLITLKGRSNNAVWEFIAS